MSCPQSCWLCWHYVCVVSDRIYSSCLPLTCFSSQSTTLCCRCSDPCPSCSSLAGLRHRSPSSTPSPIPGSSGIYPRWAPQHFALPKVGPATLYTTKSGPCYTLFYPRWAPLHFILPKVGTVTLYSTQGGPRYTLFYSRWASLHFILLKVGPTTFTGTKVGPTTFYSTQGGPCTTLKYILLMYISTRHSQHIEILSNMSLGNTYLSHDC